MIYLDYSNLCKYIANYNKPPFLDVSSYFALKVKSDFNFASDCDDIKIKCIPQVDSSPQLWVITGGIASGKSTIAYSLIRFFQLETLPYISSDYIYKAFFNDCLDFDFGYNRARTITDKSLSVCINNGISLVWETVFSKDKKKEIIQMFKERGFSINCFYVSVDNIDELNNRSTERTQYGYHFVSSDFISDRYNKTVDSMTWLFPLCDKVCVLQNNTDLLLAAYSDNTVVFLDKTHIDSKMRKYIL